MRPDVLSSRHVAAVRQTSDVLLSADARLVDLFYERLFSIAPDARALFRNDLAVLKLKFRDTLATLIGSVDHPDMFTSIVEHLGIRHARYGVQPDHYAAVGSALISSLEAVLAERFTPEVREAWSALYAAISGVMTRMEVHR